MKEIKYSTTLYLWKKGKADGHGDGRNMGDIENEHLEEEKRICILRVHAG